MTASEKKSCLAQLQTSQAVMLSVLGKVSEKAFTYKSDPEIWSIAEVVEHVIKVETAVTANLQQLGKEKPTAQLENPLSNDKILELSSSRKLKSQAPAPFLPAGIFTNKEDAIAVFKQCRMQSKHFLDTNTLTLETIVHPHPRIGLLNGNQWLLFISGHSLKHVAQIREIMEEQEELFSES